MKLVLANNQSETFKDFHQSIQADAPFYDYAGYKSLLFEFNVSSGVKHLSFVNVDTSKKHSDYTGVYINGYLNTPEIAATVATVLDANGITYINRELANAPSLSKLTMYAKLVNAGVQIPHTYAGSAYALRSAQNQITLEFPAILKRADADRGIDNFKVKSFEEAVALLADHDELSLWILQSFIPNDGFYLVSVYNNVPAFGIYRTLEERPDGNEQKAHMFKPKGGANASLIEIADLPSSLVETSVAAANAMNRQMASVDSLYDKATNTTYVLEVNYNPQLVTIQTLKEVRQKAFLKTMRELGEA
jgi:glutathione synthase/RimK-type ligase-like ATP-grasp enzyme